MDEDDHNLLDQQYQKVLNQSMNEKEFLFLLIIISSLPFFHRLEYQQHMYQKSLHHDWE
jgi:hypothetical protein